MVLGGGLPGRVGGCRFFNENRSCQEAAFFDGMGSQWITDGRRLLNGSVDDTMRHVVSSKNRILRPGGLVTPKSDDTMRHVVSSKT